MVAYKDEAALRPGQLRDIELRILLAWEIYQHPSRPTYGLPKMTPMLHPPLRLVVLSDWLGPGCSG